MTQPSDAQLKQLQSLLQNRKHVLLDDLQRDAQALRDDSARMRATGADAGELSDSDHAAAVSATEMARDASELQTVELALDRMARGEYGTCVECAEPIALQRLLANPMGIRCVSCQTRYEQTHPHPAPHTL